MNYSIERLDHIHCGPVDILGLVQTYKDVYGGDPKWNEHLRCPNCGENFGRDVEAEICPHCDPHPPLVEFWTTAQVLTDFYHEMSLPHAVCFVARDTNGRIIGLCWGFFMKTADLVKHLKTPELDQQLTQHFQHNGHYAYQDEIAVLPEWQKHGIGTSLFQARHEHFATVDPEAISLFRTLQNPPSATYSWMVRKWGYQIVLEYEDEGRQKVIVGLPIKEALAKCEPRGINRCFHARE